MFMRNRGHTCDMCIQIDEHHYKRHLEICQQIRTIYELCGEDWPIIPEDEDRRGRSRSGSPDEFESDSRSPPPGAPLKKKDKKELKRQVRAASRTKVITQEDIKYLESVLHPAASSTDTNNPNNSEEIEEIERHLKYNAKCYNYGQKRSDIQQFAHITGADIDFENEIGRILEVLRVADLLNRNDRNRGMQNKELAKFKTLVSAFKDCIITDLVQAKRDELEIRMRRAAFLRYTNRSTYEAVTDRYIDKDWKTGEKYLSTGSGSVTSDSLTAVEGDVSGQDDITEIKDMRDISTPTLSDADRRHFERDHKKIGRDGQVEDIPAIKETRPTQKGNIPKAPQSLRIINTDFTPQNEIKFRNPWGSEGLAAEEDDGWHVVGAKTSHVRTSDSHSDTHSAYEDRAPSFQKDDRDPTDESSSFITCSPCHSNTSGSLALGSSPTNGHFEEQAQFPLATAETRTSSLKRMPVKIPPEERLALPKANSPVQEDEEKLQKLQLSNEEDDLPPHSPPDTISTTKTGRHKDWLKFANSLKLDAVSQPLFTMMHPAYVGCTDSLFVDDCPFYVSGTPDCPYHKAYCKCIDPFMNFKYIVYADTNPRRLGPFNYMRGEKLMAFLEQQPETKGRLMLVDEDIYDWLSTEGRAWRLYHLVASKLALKHLPMRLSWELQDYLHGSPKGRLLKQIDRFHELSDKNARLRSVGSSPDITIELLKTLCEKREPGDFAKGICYCKETVPADPEKNNELVECEYVDCLTKFFHRRCMEKLNYSHVTTWFCRDCEQIMSTEAQKVLPGAFTKLGAKPGNGGSLRFCTSNFENLDGHCDAAR